MSVVTAYRIFVCALFQVRGGMYVSTHISLHQKQRTHKYMICCHNTQNNGIFIILTWEISQKIYVLPDDDMQCAIETCRSSESVLTLSRLMTYIYIHIYIYIYRTASLTSRCSILYIYSTNIRTEYFKHAAHSPFFPL